MNRMISMKLHLQFLFSFFLQSMKFFSSIHVTYCRWASFYCGSFCIFSREAHLDWSFSRTPLLPSISPLAVASNSATFNLYITHFSVFKTFIACLSSSNPVSLLMMIYCVLKFSVVILGFNCLNSWYWRFLLVSCSGLHFSWHGIYWCSSSTLSTIKACSQFWRQVFPAQPEPPRPPLPPSSSGPQPPSLALSCVNDWVNVF